MLSNYVVLVVRGYNWPHSKSDRRTGHKVSTYLAWVQYVQYLAKEKGKRENGKPLTRGHVSAAGSSTSSKSKATNER